VSVYTVARHIAIWDSSSGVPGGFGGEALAGAATGPQPAGMSLRCRLKALAAGGG
jgi:hypothetical protein